MIKYIFQWFLYIILLGFIFLSFFLPASCHSFQVYNKPAFVLNEEEVDEPGLERLLSTYLFHGANEISLNSNGSTAQPDTESINDEISDEDDAIFVPEPQISMGETRQAFLDMVEICAEGNNFLYSVMSSRDTLQPGEIKYFLRTTSRTMMNLGEASSLLGNGALGKKLYSRSLQIAQEIKKKHVRMHTIIQIALAAAGSLQLDFAGKTLKPVLKPLKSAIKKYDKNPDRVLIHSGCKVVKTLDMLGKNNDANVLLGQVKTAAELETNTPSTLYPDATNEMVVFTMLSLADRRKNTNLVLEADSYVKNSKFEFAYNRYRLRYHCVLQLFKLGNSKEASKIVNELLKLKSGSHATAMKSFLCTKSGIILMKLMHQYNKTSLAKKVLIKLLRDNKNLAIEHLVPCHLAFTELGPYKKAVLRLEPMLVQAEQRLERKDTIRKKVMSPGFMSTVFRARIVMHKIGPGTWDIEQLNPVFEKMKLYYLTLQSSKMNNIKPETLVAFPVAVGITEKYNMYKELEDFINIHGMIIKKIQSEEKKNLRVGILASVLVKIGQYRQAVSIMREQLNHMFTVSNLGPNDYLSFAESLVKVANILNSADKSQDFFLVDLDF